jgi:replication-associated recombination protein RarA
MKHKLFSAKFRPTKIEDVVILPRVSRDLMKGTNEIVLDKNILLVGSPGTGKTTISAIVEAEHDTLRLNASMNNSIDDLRGTVMDHCRTMSIFGHDADKPKVVFLDEFDGISKSSQDAMRGFIEEHEEHVRFVATCNNISQFTPALLSRFTVIKFDPNSAEELLFLKKAYMQLVVSKLNAEQIKFVPKDIADIINVTAPDFRTIWNQIQRRHINGEIIQDTVENLDGGTLYNYVLTEGDHTLKSYDYVMTTWGDKIDNMIKLMGRPLCDLIIAKYPQHIGAIPKLLILNKNYAKDAKDTSDPVVLALALMFEAQQIILNK